MLLTELVSNVRTHLGLHQKTEIQMVQRHLCEAHPPPFSNGDDAAVIPNAEGFDLLAGEGFMDEFVSADPWFAGWCGVMVNISDIAAMGGRPVAIVNALWGGSDDSTAAILQGMSAASRAYQVPIVGGHTNLRSDRPHLAVSILGRAKKVLSSFSARPGQHLVAAIDLRGAYQAPFLNWNAATSAPPERLRSDLALLPYIAEQGLSSVAKDISQAGILGTCVMLMESAGVGADIQLQAIPKPVEIPWQQWLQSFPSFGYLLTTDTDNLQPLLNTFAHNNISAAAIGTLNHSRQCCIHHDNQSALFWDLNNHPLTAMTEERHA
jgi:AIR synthase-related protein